jgi:hypothetical protein
MKVLNVEVGYQKFSWGRTRLSTSDTSAGSIWKFGGDACEGNGSRGYDLESYDFLGGVNTQHVVFATRGKRRWTFQRKRRKILVS